MPRERRFVRSTGVLSGSESVNGGGQLDAYHPSWLRTTRITIAVVHFATMRPSCNLRRVALETSHTSATRVTAPHNCACFYGTYIGDWSENRLGHVKHNVGPGLHPEAQAHKP